jgi:predicted dehydrogenase
MMGSGGGLPGGDEAAGTVSRAQPSNAQRGRHGEDRSGLMNRGPTGVAVVGCGYVFDHYMATWARHPDLALRGVHDIDGERAATVASFYGLHDYGSMEALLADPAVDIVVNLTSIGSHYRVTQVALEAGKHVYTEKPVAEGWKEAQQLYEIAERSAVLLAAAPSNILSPTLQTMWRAVRDGAIGEPRVVYAEFDDNPVPLMHPESWRSRSGAPWPYLDEYEHGCTIEHGGYHLTWLCAMFGPVDTVTALSKQVIPDKPSSGPGPVDTPDLALAVLHFASGVVARLTFSIVAPLSHGMQIVGERGMLTAETYRDYECPVYLERFSDLTLNARKARSVRNDRWLSRLLGVGGWRLPLVPSPYGRAPSTRTAPTSLGLLQRLKRRETGVQDKCMGIAELADAVVTGREPFPPPDLTVHATEVVYAIHEAGSGGSTYSPRTTFESVSPHPDTLAADLRYRQPVRLTLLNALLRGPLSRMHQQ